MTESQSRKFSKILDLNWEASHEKDPMKKWDMYKELHQMKKDLRDDMGHEEYDHFMEMGSKMLAPLKSEA